MFDPTRTAFIFDMDGTILDNMMFHTRAWLQVLDELGLPTQEPDEWERRTSGVPNRTILRELLGLNLDDAGIARWVERKESLYRKHAAGLVREVPGCIAYIRRMRRAGAHIALATGAGRTNIDFNLRALGIQDDFDAQIGADDVQRGKPEPDVFLTAAARLGAAPEDCVVFEDAPMGLEAARRAGMRAVCITSMMTETQAREWPNVVAAVRDYEISSLANVGLTNSHE
ncbi:MAG: beta-phosphoglucomutase family hydrolase [Chloroflexi bacterium]|nr:beta-phosphoglucomutase family hydrolase [Chloroflexota bacterium]